MKEYIKPCFETKGVLTNNIASSGLQDWLNGAGADYANVDIVTYELVS